eukprot:GILK01004813.1.p1 GENE.GILK01004813.1~~GILK01004813.1.p1  ORF type:complete len:175 (-),score=17.62 GILK01004813.1:108-599(-)
MGSRSHFVFVYGTLKTGFPNHYYLQLGGQDGYEYIGQALTKERYPMVLLNKRFVPALLHVAGSGNRIAGEVFKVDDKILAHLDELEGVASNYYTRQIIEIDPIDFGAEQITGPCFVYFLCRDGNPEFIYEELLLEAHLAEYTSIHATQYIPKWTRAVEPPALS